MYICHRYCLGYVEMLSAAQCAAFESQGVVLVPDVLSPAELVDAKATWCV